MELNQGHNPFSNLDDQFAPLTFSFMKNVLKTMEENDKRNDNKGGFSVVAIYAILGAAAILIFVGKDVVKIIFRENFGKKGFNLYQVLLGAIAFGVTAGTNYALAFDEYSNLPYSPFVFFTAGIFYTIATVYILVKAFREKKKNNNVIHEAYRGDSIYFDFLLKEGWSPAKVQNVAEPMTLLGLGVLLSGVNPFWGIPLIVCACSVWLFLLCEMFYGVSNVRDVLANQGYKVKISEDYSDIIN